MDSDHQDEAARPLPPARATNGMRWLALWRGIAAAVVFLIGLYLEIRH